MARQHPKWLNGCKYLQKDHLINAFVSTSPQDAESLHARMWFPKYGRGIRFWLLGWCQHPRDQTSVEQVLHPHHGSVAQIPTTHGRCWPKWKCSRLLQAQCGRRAWPWWNSRGHLSKHKKPDYSKQFEVEPSVSCFLNNFEHINVQYSDLCLAWVWQETGLESCEWTCNRNIS